MVQAETKFTDVVNSLTLLALIACSCAPTLPLLQFQDIRKQELRKKRAYFKLGVDLTSILEREGVMPEKILSIKSFGRIYIVAEGFKNLYHIVPKNSKCAQFKVVELVREQVHPFQEPVFEWAANEQFVFKWRDPAGVHENVINKDGKAR